jgi:hypothetical protein
MTFSMSDEPWHLSKSVPITFILAIFLQTIAIIWFVATLRSDVDNNKADILRAESKVESLNSVVVNQSILLARIDENLKVIKDALEKGK